MGSLAPTGMEPAKAGPTRRARRRRAVRTAISRTASTVDLKLHPFAGRRSPPGEYILSLADDSELSPSDPLHPRQFIKVLVSAEDRQPVLDRKGRDPGIVSRDWSTQPFQ